jgi:hypothetical protein
MADSILPCQYIELTFPPDRSLPAHHLPNSAEPRPGSQVNDLQRCPALDTPACNSTHPQALPIHSPIHYAHTRLTSPDQNSARSNPPGSFPPRPALPQTPAQENQPSWIHHSPCPLPSLPSYGTCTHRWGSYKVTAVHPRLNSPDH